MAVTRAIELKTRIPGPKSAAILERIDRSVAAPLSITLPIVAAEARGATLTDVDGNTFIDFTGGVGCLNVGHSHPRVVEAAQAQLEKFSHTDFTVVPYEVYVDLAERLIELAPVRKPAKAAFFNAGTEAVENAVKFARSYTKRPAIICFEGAFHGRTLMSMSLTSKTHPYKAGLGPFAPEVYRVPFPQDYRGPSTAEALAALERAFTTLVAAETVAAIVVEAVQGEGGFIVAPPEFLQGVRRICDERGIVMVVDEVQTGYGRTGKMFATEHYGIEADLILVAKSIAAGLPLSGVIGTAEIMDAPGEAAVGGTYVGNPVAQAAALAVLDVFEDEGVVEHAASIGETMRQRMLSWQERFPAIGDVRGLGAMLAIELVEDRQTKEPAPALASAVIEAATERGLLLLKSGIHSNCIRVLCPLTISEAELDEALAVWEEALE
ncbi:MAG: 4-aminobutyrate aminotransferase / (S)-3-amino-2-methylpropionate transaminase / 5-aminovalerate, partial [Gaiellaceae bacterium]|nr:4-aminobutyrate aminotransferase / (S)-3-amino-2-methylpropionate transaminase / 5-aminovalerate [Gaiellaceae bacterium]